MDMIARDAQISRPGLYFMFESKEALFRASVSHVLAQDLTEVEEVLEDRGRGLRERLLDAFDRWAGRYVGPMAQDIPMVIAENSELLSEDSRAAPARFHAALVAAIDAERTDAEPIAQTLSSVSVGLIHQVSTREAYRERLGVAISQIVP